MQKTLAQVLDWSLRDINRIDAHLLLQHVLGVEQAYILTHIDQLLTPQQESYFSQLIAKRVEGVPIAYLIGEREFYSLTFSVSDAVLIPRPETELLVDLTLARMPQDKPCRILDLGSGCGAVAITIAKYRPESQVIAIDYSAAAISVARSNARNLNINNIEIRRGDWFKALAEEKFDLIVSNPPYVAEHDPHLQQGDLRFEPPLALSAGEDGLMCIRHIIANAPKYLATDGWLLFEHGYNQAAACRDLLAKHRFCALFSEKDLAGIIRVSGGCLHSN